MISLLTPLGSLILCGACVYELYARYRARRLPPGISGLRCLFHMPRKQPWSKFLQFNQQYGDIASMSFLGHNIILINSAQIARDLLEKRGVNYSDRPKSIMAAELSGRGKTLILSNHNEWHRTQRKWFAQDIGSYALVSKLHGMFEFEVRRYLRNILEDPEKNQAHLRKYYASTLLRIAHGYMTQEGDDPLVKMAHVSSTQFAMTTAPGAYYVDFIHLLKYIPSWFPGAEFKRKAKYYSTCMRDLAEVPHNYVKSQLAAGTAMPSLSSRVMTQPEITEELVDCVKWATASMLGTADTASSTSYAFWLAMTLYPRVVEKAQQELDTVVGKGRLPTFSDRPALPYMEALYTELLRWHSPSPLTIRCSRVDDEYNGYVIPGGSYLLVNVIELLRDARTYSDPLEFKPERFMGDKPEPHPENVCFGFGRRKCPGSFLSHSAVWLMCAQSLAVFDISKCVENGVEITPEYNLVGGSVIHPAPFKCSIKPRFAEAEGLIRQEVPILVPGESA